MQRESQEHSDPDNISCPEIIKLLSEWDLITCLIGLKASYCSEDVQLNRRNTAGHKVFFKRKATQERGLSKERKKGLFQTSGRDNR